MVEFVLHAFKFGELGFLFTGIILIIIITIILETIYRQQKNTIRLWSTVLWLVFIIIYGGWCIFKIFNSA